jgi:N-glycosylase/DNA lyase
MTDSDLRSAGIDWHALWSEFGWFYVDRVSAAIEQGSRNPERELLFCLLGGHGITFELASSATTVLERLDIFDSDYDLQRLEGLIRAELDKPQFEPRRHDGSRRRYRYPRRKAELIARAAGWAREQGPLAQRLSSIGDERSRRAFLCECPGVGLKTASWMLRNIGLGEALAVIDIHVLTALVAVGRVRNMKLPRDYEAVEHCFLSWCKELKAPPAAFDLMLWEWQRTA